MIRSFIFALSSLFFLFAENYAYAIDKKEMLAVVEQNTGRVDFYSTQNGQALGGLKVGYLPHEIIIAKDKKTAYVSNFGVQDYDETIGIPGTTISVIDIPSRTEKFRLYTFDPAEHKNFSELDKAPHGMRLRPPQEKQLYVNLENGSKLIVFDLVSRKIIKKFNINSHTHNLFFSPDGKILWLMAGPDGVIRMDPDTGNITGQFKLSTPIRGLSYTPDQRYLMASAANEIVFFDPNNLTIQKKFTDLAVGQILYSDMTVDGKYIIAPAVWDSQAIVIDTQSGKVIKRIVTGLDPVTVKISPAGKFAYVTNARDDHVTQINLKNFTAKNIMTADGPNSLAVVPFYAETPHKIFTLGAALPLSGKDGKKGREMMLGYEFWRSLVRQAGGLWIQEHPYDVDIVYLDTRSDEARIAPLIKELINKYKVEQLLGTYGSNANEIEKEMALQNHVRVIPLPKLTENGWQPNDIAVGEDFFITSKTFQEQFQAHYNLKPSYLSATATAAGILLQQSLLTSPQSQSFLSAFNTFNPRDPHHQLYIPAGKGPFPAILMLHASGGIEKVNEDWANFLKQQGYIVYIIDSFNPRGYKNRKSIGWDKATAAQLADIAPAYHYLSTLQKVDAKRIGLLGFSMGGYDVLRTMQINDPDAMPDLRNLAFKAAASFYGVCKMLSPSANFKGPVKIFIGEKDDRATMSDCEKLAGRTRNISIVSYLDAQHGFDNSAFPPIKELIDEKGEKYHIGYNEKAQLAARKDLLHYFQQTL